MIYIRVDGNEIIATGHVMRCLAIAEAARKLGEDATFILADDAMKEVIEEKRFSTIVINSKWNNLEEEINQVIHIIKKKNIEILLIDSYYVTRRYLLELKKHTNIAYIDDLNQCAYPVDLLINYGLYEDRLNYANRYANEGNIPRFLLGASYAPLSPQFEARKRCINNNVKKVMITTGGTDSYGVIDALLDKLRNADLLSDIEYHIILGKFNLQKQYLINKWYGYKKIIFFENVKKMSEHMTECDIAITAAGSTVYELCACGTPSIVYLVADNQQENVEAVSKRKLMTYVGDVRQNKSKCIESMVDEMLKLSINRDRRIKESIELQNCVDGRGAIRIMQNIIGLVKKKG